MSILFGNAIAVKETDSLEFASEKVCRVIPRNELTMLVEGYTEGTYWKFIDPDKIRGKFIEIKPGAYTDEQMQAIMGGETYLLYNVEYGIKWRAWDGGKPYAEQMAATAWEV